MSDRLDNNGINNSSEEPNESPCWNDNKTFQSSKDAVLPAGFNPGKGNGPDEDGSDGEKPAFKSRFSKWLRTTALIIILIFVPEQISWAFNYNPLVLWGDKKNQAVSVNPNATADEITSARIAGSVNRLLSQIANKGKTRIKLQLSNAATSKSKSKENTILIDSDTAFTAARSLLGSAIQIFIP